MNDLIRPSLYGSYHRIGPVRDPPLGTRARTRSATSSGPCESGDFLAKDRPLSRPAAGDLLAVMSAGAYGFAMCRQLQRAAARRRGARHGRGRYAVARRRETYDDLVRGERVAARP